MRANKINTSAGIKGLGWQPDLPDWRDHSFQPAAALRLAELPHVSSVRANCPPVWDQLSLGSCTANSISSALMFDQLKQGEKLTPLSRLFLYFNERGMEGTVDQDAGAQIRDGIVSALSDGICPEAEWGYDISKFAIRPPQSCYHDALQFKAVKYARLTQSVYTMRYCIAGGYPFVGGFTCYESLESDATAKTGDIPMPGPTEQVIGGHAILFVGYDDKRRVFELMNSWGTGWGDTGFGTIPYDYLSNPDLASDFWEIKSVQ